MLRRFLDKHAPAFAPGGRFARLYPLYEALDTFLYTPGQVTTGAAHVRDQVNMKRLMMTVVLGLTPAMFMAMFNTGYQANLALAAGFRANGSWQYALTTALGVGFDPQNMFANFVHGAAYYLPLFLLTFLVGGFWETLFASVRKHEINEGFLITGMLFPLLLPPNIPLWQAALGISFGVVVGKEIFGGVGYNILNPALTARVFLFFAYPGQISGNACWVAVDGYSSATPLAAAAEHGAGALTGNPQLWWDAFYGWLPGSMGETSALALGLGGVLLLVTGVASARIIFSITLGTIAMSLLLNAVGSETNAMMALPFWWHMVIGGWALGTIFMATDPVSAPYSDRGKLIYGLAIGVLVVLVRALNPAYPEGMMLSILLMNVFAPLIDHYVVQAHTKKRMARHGR